MQLGEFLFQLAGLSVAQAHLLREAWGPFILPITEEDSSFTLESAGRLQFHLDSPPDSAPVLFSRGTDVLITSGCGGPPHVWHCWVDGSLGSLEASLQVVLQWVLQAHGGLLVHASAGVWQDQGWLIPGPSGAGKTTAAREGGFDLVLSDEMVVILPDLLSSTSLNPSSFRLHSTPFWSEGRRLPLVVQSAPLKFIMLPFKAASPKVLPLSKAVAISALMGAITLYEEERGNTSRRHELFDITCAVCEWVSCFELHFPRSGPWIDQLNLDE